MIKMILKFLLAGGLIYWLIQKGSLDFSLFSDSRNSYGIWILVLFLLSFNVIFTALRWRALLQVKTKKDLSALSIVKINYIGTFFSSILPGAVTGDLIKLVYVKDLDSNFSKTFLIMSAFMDRLIGLMGLLSLLGLSSLLYYRDIEIIAPALIPIVKMNFLIFAGTVAFLFALFMPLRWQAFVIKMGQSVPVLGSKIGKTFEQIFLFGQHKHILAKALLMSFVTQLLNVFSFWILTSPFYSTPLLFKYAFTFIPLGLVATAIPISPAGLGVGHAIFDTLFNLFNIQNGASLFNLFFFANITVNLVGFIPYLLAGKKHTLKETEELG